MRTLLNTSTFLLALALILGACSGSSTGTDPSNNDDNDENPGDDNTEVTTGTLEARVATTGSVEEQQGDYTLILNESDEKSSAVADTVFFTELDEASHEIELSEIGERCAPQGDNPKSFSITAGDTTAVSFSIECTTPVEPLINKIIVSGQIESGNTELYLIDSDGSNPTELDNGNSSGPNQDVFPDISPDGKQIVFVIDFDIYVVRADGSGQTQLTDTEDREIAPRWSPDGTQIAFHKNDDIYLMNADGTELQQITETGDNRYPEWSPDGSKISFMSFRDGDGEIYIMNLDDSALTQITDNDERDDIPAWSPDGSQIAFTSYRDGQEEIYVMDADGLNQTRLTEGSSTQDSHATWSPDGTTIAFLRHTQTFEGLSYDIYSIAPDGSNLTEITSEFSSIVHLDWSPVGE